VRPTPRNLGVLPPRSALGSFRVALFFAPIPYNLKPTVDVAPRASPVPSA
jgi:hypothetical protein